MKHKILSIIIISLISITFFNCSEIQDEITQAPVLEGVHPDGFAKLGAENFHGTVLKTRNWDMSGCKSCHASDFSGGLSGFSCNGCHTSADGPEACNTCHGVFADLTKIAPPSDLNNNFKRSQGGVGLTQLHFYKNILGYPLVCFDAIQGMLVVVILLRPILMVYRQKLVFQIIVQLI